jgi:hypothetical protein
MSTQQEFFDALLDADRVDAPCPAGLVSWNHSDPARRFAVYRNNVMVSLIDALADAFPVAQELVGEEFFRAMAKRFVLAHPPRSRILAYYGQEFPAFVEAFAPAASVPYLADVMRLEMLRILAYHAADAKVIAPGEVAAVLAEEARLSELRLLLHPSLAVLRSPYAVVSLWGAHQGLFDIASVEPVEAQTALVVRIGLDVSIVGIDVASGFFIEQLLLGSSLAQAATSTSEFPQFDLASSLGTLLRWHCISALTFMLRPRNAPSHES